METTRLSTLNSRHGRSRDVTFIDADVYDISVWRLTTTVEAIQRADVGAVCDVRRFNFRVDKIIGERKPDRSLHHLDH